MTEHSILREARRACETIGHAFGSEMEIHPWDQAGAKGWSLRPKVTDDNPSLSLVLTASPLTATATVLPDTFAGRLVRHLGFQAVASKHEWAEICSDAESAGVHIALGINGSPRSPSDLDVGPWESLEIAADIAIKRPVTSESTNDAWITVGLVLLSLLLVGGEHDDTEEDDLEGLSEGERIERQSIRYERSQVNRIRCIEYHGCDCYVCGFNFKQVYGNRGDGYIEVHHKIPVATMPPGYRPNPRTEMVPLCANCHRMVHRTRPPGDPDELKGAL